MEFISGIAQQKWYVNNTPIKDQVPSSSSVIQLILIPSRLNICLLSSWQVCSRKITSLARTFVLQLKLFKSFSISTHTLSISYDFRPLYLSVIRSRILSYNPPEGGTLPWQWQDYGWILEIFNCFSEPKMQLVFLLSCHAPCRASENLLAFARARNMLWPGRSLRKRWKASG